MKKKHSKHYNEYFYEQHIEGMSSSASVILGLLYKFYKPQTVIDIGCAQGAWLAVAESLGATKLKGMDGKWVNKEAMRGKNIIFTEANFDESVPTLGEKYDLCISVEVAEHIREENAKRFIDFLCQASDIVLFSAAIKYQGGTNHINEQRQSYWIELFNSNGYTCIDCFRGNLWNDNLVEWWYRQNILLFVGPHNTQLDIKTLKAFEKPISDVVHPDVYERKLREQHYPTLKFCWRIVRRHIANKFRKTSG